jgi:enolase
MSLILSTIIKKISSPVFRTLDQAGVAVATGCGQTKTSPLSRPDRGGEYNQFLRIEQLIGKNPVYSGPSALPKGR